MTNKVERREIPSDIVETVECDKCQCKTFKPVIIMHRIPALASPDGESKIVDNQVLACEDCSNINKEILDKISVFINVQKQGGNSE